MEAHRGREDARQQLLRNSFLFAFQWPYICSIARRKTRKKMLAGARKMQQEFTQPELRKEKENRWVPFQFGGVHASHWKFWSGLDVPTGDRWRFVNWEKKVCHLPTKKGLKDVHGYGWGIPAVEAGSQISTNIYRASSTTEASPSKVMRTMASTAVVGAGLFTSSQKPGKGCRKAPKPYCITREIKMKHWESGS